MNKDNKYIEKKIKKYVIATIDGAYLKKTPAKNEYCFVEDIEIATKTMSKKMIQQVLDYYYQDTMTNIELVIVPVEITYELIDESN